MGQYTARQFGAGAPPHHTTRTRTRLPLRPALPPKPNPHAHAAVRVPRLTHHPHHTHPPHPPGNGHLNAPQFPLDTAGADRAELDSLEYQVFNAIQTWRDMPSASQVVAAKAQGREVQHAAALMGFRVNRRERQSEDAIIAMRVGGWPPGDPRAAGLLCGRTLVVCCFQIAWQPCGSLSDPCAPCPDTLTTGLTTGRLPCHPSSLSTTAPLQLKMKKAAQEEEAKRVERAHQEKLEQWQRRRAAQERRLCLEKEQAEEDVAAAEAAVARLHGKAKAAPAAAMAGLEASSSDEEGGQTLAARAGSCGGSAKRKAAVLEDSEDERDGGKENAAQRHTAKRPPASRHRVSMSVWWQFCILRGQVPAQLPPLLTPPCPQACCCFPSPGASHPLLPLPPLRCWTATATPPPTTSCRCRRALRWRRAARAPAGSRRWPSAWWRSLWR